MQFPFPAASIFQLDVIIIARIAYMNTYMQSTP